MYLKFGIIHNLFLENYSCIEWVEYDFNLLYYVFSKVSKIVIFLKVHLSIINDIFKIFFREGLFISYIMVTWT